MARVRLALEYGMTLQRQQVLQTLSALCPDWDATQVSEFRFLEGGYSNANFQFDYQGAQYVIRIPRATQPFIDWRWEEDWYTRLSAHPMVVRPIAYDTASGGMITPWVDGQLLIDAHKAGSITTSDIEDFFAHFHQSLPAVSRHYPLDQLLETYQQAVGQLSAQNKDHSYRTGTHLRGAPPPDASLGACHNDLNPWNVIISPTGWVVLDWEVAGLNDPVFDIVALCEGLSLAREQLTSIVISYLSANPSVAVDKRIQVNLVRYWYRELYWAEYQLARGNNRDEIAEQAAEAKHALNVLL